MAITFLAPLLAGNAVQIFLQPPAGARRWRLLRKRADTIASADDPGANVVLDGDDKAVIDRRDLVNGTTYFYRAFYLNGATWVASDSRSVVVQDGIADISPDVLDVVRERVDLGFATFVKRGQLQHHRDSIPVLLASPAIEDATFPMVTVHAMSIDPAERFLGDEMSDGVFIEDDDETVGADGWLARYQIMIIVWCSNGDVRTAMRKALLSIVQANLPVFESAGMTLIEPRFNDADDMNTYQVPMYQATCTLTCIAPTAVESRTPGIIREVEFSFTTS